MTSKMCECTSTVIVKLNTSHGGRLHQIIQDLFSLVRFSCGGGKNAEAEGRRDKKEKSKNCALQCSVLSPNPASVIIKDISGIIYTS